MTYKEYATNLYRFFGKISILSKISTPTEEIYNKKSFESLERERNQYKQLKIARTVLQKVLISMQKKYK